MPATLPSADAVTSTAPVTSTESTPIVTSTETSTSTQTTDTTTDQVRPPGEPDKRGYVPTGRKTKDGNDIYEVPSDWKPRNMEEGIGEKLGEFVRKSTETKTTLEQKATRQQSEAPEITADTTDAELAAHVDDLAKRTRMSKEQRDAFQNKTEATRRYKRELKEATSQLETVRAQAAEAENLRQQIAELQKAPKGSPETEALAKQLQADLDALKTEKQQIEEQLYAASVERSPQYRDQINKPMRAIEELATKLSKKYDLKEGDVLSALRSTGEDRADILNDLAADMKPYDATEFAAAARDYGILAADRDTILANARQHAEQMQQQETARQEQARLQQQERTAAQQKEWEAAIEPTWQEVLKKAGLERSADNEKYNAVFDNAARFAKEVPFAELTVTGQAEAMHRAAVFPLILGKNLHLESRVQQLEAELKRYEGATPGAGEGSRGRDIPNNPGPKAPKGAAFESNLDAQIQAAIRDGSLGPEWS